MRESLEIEKNVNFDCQDFRLKRIEKLTDREFLNKKVIRYFLKATRLIRR